MWGRAGAGEREGRVGEESGKGGAGKVCKCLWGREGYRGKAVLRGVSLESQRKGMSLLPVFY